MKFFDSDGPLMQGLNKVADLMILDLIALICCIPIITIGASMTALHYMALKIVRGEEVYIIKGFIKSFKQNFRQATVIWMIQIIVMAVLVLDYFIIFWNPESNPSIPVQALFLAAMLITLSEFVFIYPILSKFDNSILRTFKNTFAMAIMQFPKIILMLVFWAAPILIGIFVIQLLPLVVLFGLSLPAYGSALLYNKFFKKLEDQVIAQEIAAGKIPANPGSEDEHIFSDAIDPALEAKKEAKK